MIMCNLVMTRTPGAIPRRFAAHAETQRGKSAKGGGAVACRWRQVLGCLGALHVPDDGAPFLQVRHVCIHLSDERVIAIPHSTVNEVHRNDGCCVGPSVRLCSEAARSPPPSDIRRTSTHTSLNSRALRCRPDESMNPEVVAHGGEVSDGPRQGDLFMVSRMYSA